ncbi:Protein-lysine N-methyltransferase M142.8 [Caenorhabditis elegans]|uniref:Protein-lysine N-methyltransferase M142.8 n=2 Tax=Caenorhabditis elegans TaxID=6239 RepID=EFM5_CAEEL|nr:Protein-lysine N-methyltransferase M142.8 [Caenorhabditis elegans]Q5WRN3.1 RecName: Full=Protein-lysine N-methyltransferase M142.8 [Caenorhabditis elegans]CAH60777.1 Protein-lysine N-methyltransferase M142.8 [Caenorhabditis elegans]|eukprot:NP_001255091.1 Protein-lysine N-methyltransferase M142.8 [Caenorhabditis elegans]
MSDTDDIPQLSADTLAALSMFQAEQQEKIEQLQSGIIEKIDEDWQLSQFWYDDETSRKLVAEGVAAALEGSEARPARIGCVSSPTLVKFFHETEEYKTGQIQLTLFEFDDRFGLKFPTEFVHYDYKHPTDLPAELLAKFDVIIADPPFLAAECLIKTAHSIRLLGKSDVKVLLCTGAIMEDYASRLMAMHRTSFEPRHANNLANDFSCFANYQTLTFC